MTRSHSKKTKTVPPQLLGVLDDTFQIAATTVRLETFPTLVMASFAMKSQAVEIDFTMAAGRAMIDCLMVQSRANPEGKFTLEYEGRRLDCRVTSDRQRRPSWVEMSWV